MSSSHRRDVRFVVGVLVIAVILAAFLHRQVSGEPLQPWLVLLVSVLGLAAATAVFGKDAVRLAAAIFGDGEY